MTSEPGDELANVEDYFPYVGHDLDHDEIRRSDLWHNVIGNLVDQRNTRKVADFTRLETPFRGSFLRRGLLFKRVDVHGLEPHRRIAADPNAVEALVPRHRSLYDYCLGMPMHHELVNPEVMVLAGSNLFVSKFDYMLRHFGGFMFLREDTVLSRRDLPKAFLSVKRYVDDVLPAYLRQQMVDGVGPNRVKRDLILYAGQEKNPATGKRGGGRSKSGRLRNLSPIFFDKFKQLAKGSSTALYVAPVNISFSKYPDAPFIAHPIEKQGLLQTMRYVGEQSFVMRSYPRFAQTHPNAQLEAVVRYGEPERLDPDALVSFRDLIAYGHDVRERIGRLESIFPAVLVYRAMDRSLNLPLAALDERVRRLYDHYGETDIDVEKVSTRPGAPMPIRELVDCCVRTLNRNPAMYIWGVRHDRIMTLRLGRVHSHDRRLQSWYANNIRHLDP